MVRIGSVNLDTPVMNAACSVAKSMKDVEALAKTGVGAILVGSITVEPRAGNPQPQWFTTEHCALNSFGMPNGGLEFYRVNLPKMRSIAHKAGKKIVLSIAGFNPSEYTVLSRLAEAAKVDLLELNFGCPNISTDGKQKLIMSFDPISLRKIIKAVSETTTIPLMVKVSPYSNPTQLAHVATVIRSTKSVSAVVTMNTFPNGYYTQQGKPVLAHTFGGVSGGAILPIALGQVRQFREALPKSIAVVGVGGIETAEAAKQHFDAGADFIQCATLIVQEGHQAIDRVISHL
jgi:dihydroorotate dehydrogenase (fumarate)